LQGVHKAILREATGCSQRDKMNKATFVCLLWTA
jgi:hypothetical protein